MQKQIVRKREEIPEEMKWRLEDMYPTDEEWESECAKTLALAEKSSEYQDTLQESAEQLYEYLKLKEQIAYYLGRVYVYANERYHQDTTVAKYQAYADKAERIRVEVSEATAFEEPEILRIPEETMEQFYREEPGLRKYQRMVSELFRQKEHTLSTKEEGLLAQANEMAAGPGNIFSMLNNADIHFHSITDMEGNRIPITHGNFIVLLNQRDRHIRKRAFRSVYDAYQRWGNTITATFLAQLKKEHFFAKARNYKSTRAMHLSEGNIPEAVYDNLIATVHKFLPAMHRYMKIRKEVLGLEELHMYDLYLPLVDSLEDSYSYEKSKEMVAEALKPMGKEYGDILQQGFTQGWIDVYENENKRSGAYSWGTYGTHPYVLLNHQDDLNSVFTLAHEMGHAIHTYYSNEAQPIVYSDYLIFVAEVASTCNESLLMDYLLRESEDEKQRSYLMNHYLEQFRTTVFRQTMFAEFEHMVHEKLAKGEALTMESICADYHELNVQYYGPDVVIDPEIDFEWMRIPHFYTSYYVYQYATGFSAAVAFSQKILKEGQPSVERYIQEFLKGGCSKDPIELLANAGVDMSTPEPIEDALSVFEDYLNMFAATQGITQE